MLFFEKKKEQKKEQIYSCEYGLVWSNDDLGYFIC